jgi:hypothetical protein
MAITEPLILPDEGFANITWRIKTAAAKTGSPFTYKEQVFIHPGRRWIAEIEIIPVDSTIDAGEWEAFFAACDGPRRRFLLTDPVRPSLNGSASGTPVVDGAQTARSETLDVRGLTANDPDAFLRGDRIQLGSGVDSRLHVIQTQAGTDGSGNVTLDIWPPLRDDYADGATIVTSNAKGVFRLPGNTSEWDVEPPTIYGFKFTAVEAL